MINSISKRFGSCEKSVLADDWIGQSIWLFCLRNINDNMIQEFCLGKISSGVWYDNFEPYVMSSNICYQWYEMIILRECISSMMLYDNFIVFVIIHNIGWDLLRLEDLTDNTVKG